MTSIDLNLLARTSPWTLLLIFIILVAVAAVIIFGTLYSFREVLKKFVERRLQNTLQEPPSASGRTINKLPANEDIFAYLVRMRHSVIDEGGTILILDVSEILPNELTSRFWGGVAQFVVLVQSENRISFRFLYDGRYATARCNGVTMAEINAALGADHIKIVDVSQSDELKKL